MIEILFPKTVENILDYDAIKAAAKRYVEDTYVQIVTSFANNLVLQFMDEEHLEIIAEHVTGNKNTTLTELLDYINEENIYRECDFVSDLTGAFPEGVTYKLYEVTGWKFSDGDIFPFNEADRSYNHDGTPVSGTSDDAWMANAFDGYYVNNLLLSRFCKQYNFDIEDFDWHRKEGRRASWGNTETWMTTGGFGKPGTIHINVDEEHSVIEENGLTTVENWLGTVSHKLPINLYIEINSNFTTNAEPASSSFTGYHMAFPYEEEEGFCTNDPDWPDEVYREPEPGPEPPPQPDETPNGYIVIGSNGTIQNSISLSNMFIHQIQHSDDIVNFYFTVNGAAETEDSELESGVDAPLYNADGTIADDDLYDGAGTLTYTQANGNMFEAADGGDLISLQSGALVVNPNTDYKALSVQVEKVDSTTLTLDLCLTSDKQSVTFSANDYWYSYFASEDDKQAALDFGLPAFGTQQRQLGGFSEGFEVVILALLDANHDVVLSDTSNFYLSFMSNENGTWAIIKSISAYSTPTVFWRLKITKPDVLTGYYKQGDGYLYWDSRRTIKIKYNDGDVRTCVKATEYLDPRWADQPGYGDGTRDIDPSKVSLQWYSGGNISPHFDSGVSIWNYSVVVFEYTLTKNP